MSETSQRNINAFSSDKFRVQFSNIPTIQTDTKDLSFLYENFIKSISLPDYNLEMIQSNFVDGVINHPISKANDQLSDMLIEFRIDENFLNYFNLIEYVQEIRYGKIRRPAPSEVRNSKRKRESYIRLYDIKTIDIILLDGDRNTRKVLEFSECFIHSISSITMEFGKSEEVSFTVNIKYQEMQFKSP